MTVFLFLALSAIAYAADIKLLGTIVYEDNIYIYVRGISELSSDSVIQIGNTVCTPDQIAVASFGSMNESIRTLILVDNSKSVSEKKREDIKEILKGIVSHSADNEKIKIGTFSEEINYLCDYTNDYTSLENLIDGIIYNNQDTYLSDVLYDVISELKAEQTSLCTRIIILADGADNKDIGHPNDEVRSFIGKNQYPIYTIGIPGKNNASELETMFSFSRAADTEFFLLDGSVSNEEIVNTLLLDQNGVCIRVNPDERLKDGSNKSILLKLSTPEGVAEIMTNADMPFGIVPVEESMNVSEPTSEPEKPEVLPTISVTKEEPVTASKDDKDFQSWIFVVFGIIIAVLLAVIIVLAVVKNGKLTNPAQREHETSTTLGASVDAPPTVIGEPEIAPNDKTPGLWKQRYLILTNLENTNIFFKVPIMDVVRIGRRSTQDITLDDPKVSREHCEIILRGNLLYVKDCNAANKTLYENVTVHDEVPIVSGGELKIGDHKYRVDLVEEA